MSSSVIFAPEAVNDTLQAHKYYKKISAELAADLNSRLNQKISLIRNHPESSPTVYRHYRRILLHTFPFAIFYTIEQDHIQILALLHQRQHFAKVLGERE